MADTPDITSCNDTSATGADSLSPFYSLNYHFGMLLGVDDFATEQQYHSGKMRLHNAWLHRSGVVWGLNVTLDTAHNELHVLPGLALDAAGHELHLDADACVNLPEWFQAHKDDEGFAITKTEAGVQFDAHVEARFKACLTRQVPALLEPCNGASTGTAYSRVFETIDLRLVPGRAPAAPAAPYHRLRVLFGLEDALLPADQPIVDARADALSQPDAQRAAAFLAAFRIFAALDEIDLKPPSTADGANLLYPAPGDTPLFLADLSNITLEPTEGITGGSVDVTIRPSHIATSTIQELLCGAALRGMSKASTGPRVQPGSVKVTDSDITFDLDQDLKPASVTPETFSVTTFTDATGWQDVAVTATATTAPARVSLHLAAALASGMTVRLIARGSGPKPLLSATGVPLAEVAGGPDPAPNDGLDFVYMEVRS